MAATICERSCSSRITLPCMALKESIAAHISAGPSRSNAGAYGSDPNRRAASEKRRMGADRARANSHDSAPSWAWSVASR
jgi:hypothetical protein